MHHDYDKILTRLIVILQRLNEGECLSVSELAEEFNVSTKTIQRDFNNYLYRFPIEKVGRRWKMQEGYALERERKPEELLVLDMLETFSKGIGGSFSSVSSSMLGRLKNHTVSAVASKTFLEDIFEIQALFKEVEKAIEIQKMVSFAYKGKVRIVKPYKLVAFDGFWYLYGEEVLSEKLKTFHVKSIEALKLLETTFVKDEAALRRIDTALNVWFDAQKEPFEVLLRASLQIAKYFTRRPLCSTQRIVNTYDDGAIDIALLATTQQEVLHEVKKWIPELLVLAPRSLALRARKMAQHYAEAQIDVMLE